MKNLQIASILALSALLTFACGDDEDASPVGSAGSGSGAQAGESSGGDDAGGQAGSGQGGTSAQAGAEASAGADVGGAGGVPADTCEYGDYSAGGASDAGGAAGAGGAASAGLEMLGTWTEIFNDEPAGTLEVTSSYWNDSGIAAYDSEANLVYTQTPCDSEYNPGAFTKIVYTEPTADTFYYCMVVYDAKTLVEAQASEETADPEDLLTGCGASGFPWSKVTR
ncbi:MAG: hypothetical protein K0R38_4706 [Polyangiaceae bacterium]|nr:hypothetical protein [Polyangiaceae bacterium]